MADVSHNGGFSKFPHLSRILTVIKGPGAHLTDTNTGAVLLASLHAPIAFSGDQSISSELIDGAVVNFNVIYDPIKTNADVRLVVGPDIIHLTTREDQSLALFCLSGRLEMDQLTLKQDETALIESTDQSRLTCQPASKALLVTFTPIP